MSLARDSLNIQTVDCKPEEFAAAWRRAMRVGDLIELREPSGDGIWLNPAQILSFTLMHRKSNTRLVG